VIGTQTELRSYAPNRFVPRLGQLTKFFNSGQEMLDDLSQGRAPLVSLLILVAGRLLARPVKFLVSILLAAQDRRRFRSQNSAGR